MAGQAVLGAHGAHAVALKAAEKWPTAQLAQDDEEVAEAAVPGKQLAHTTAPGTGGRARGAARADGRGHGSYREGVGPSRAARAACRPDHRLVVTCTTKVAEGSGGLRHGARLAQAARGRPCVGGGPGNAGETGS